LIDRRNKFDVFRRNVIGQAVEHWDVVEGAPTRAAPVVAGDRNDRFNQAVIGFLRRQMPAT
jgi:predicted SnoaL-like aldol condensation-catalyzing enzyme